MTSDNTTPFLPFAAPSIGEDEIAAVSQVLREGWVTSGPKTQAFERAFADYVGVPFARAVNSCTAALHIMLVASGVGPGDEVVIPSLTFAATGNVVDHVGARPVFADVDPATLNVTRETVEAAITAKTRAVIVVHYAGLAVQLDEIAELCRARGILLLEDAAHAAGTHYKGRPIGSHTDGVSFSFYANKNLTTGEGGMLTARSPELARRFESLRLHGMSRDAWKRYTATGSWRYDIEEAGFKYNLGDIASAIGLVQLARLESFITRRNELATRMRKRLAALPGLEFQSFAPAGDRHAYHLFVVRLSTARGTPDRDAVMKSLAENRIGYSVHFIPLHTMSFYRERCRPPAGALTTTEKVADELLSLPLYPAMTDADADRVCSAVEAAFA